MSAQSSAAKAEQARACYADLRDSGLDPIAARCQMNVSEATGRHYEQYYLLDHPEIAPAPYMSASRMEARRDAARGRALYRT